MGEGERTLQSDHFYEQCIKLDVAGSEAREPSAARLEAELRQFWRPQATEIGNDRAPELNLAAFRHSAARLVPFESRSEVCEFTYSSARTLRRSLGGGKGA